MRHSANLSALYALPYNPKNRAANFVLGGWEVGGILNTRSGLPIDVTISRPDIVGQLNSTGQYVAFSANGTMTAIVNNPYGGAFRNNRRPDVVAGVDPFLHTSDGKVLLSPAAFSIPKPGTFGNLGRFALHGFPLTQFDFTLHKGFKINERSNFEFRAEFYNLFNHANFANPPAVLANALSTSFQPGQAFSLAAAGGAFGIANSTVSKDVGLGAQRQIQLSLRFNF